ncbi:MAG: hypothetical protein KAQ97_08440 [Candidatus Fermentibacteraceae bacterium]|nr:hypothetical protein [Candidatus Fermentibacteraceae bacterium]
MSNDSNLTKNEERVLFGIVKYPNKSDKFLARYLKMKDSTVNYCRNQLEKENIFQVVYIPILNRLGFELLCINFAEYNLESTLDKRKSAIENDIEIAVVNGSIILDLGVDALVEIETVSGTIDIVEAFNARVIENIVGYSSEFGEGEYSIEISTVSGDISIVN